LGKSSYLLWERHKDTGIFRAASAHRFGFSRSAEMERAIPFGFAVRLSESAKTGSPSRQREDHLAFDLEASRSAALSDLQPAARFLHKAKWVAPDAVIERAMRHTNPETKRIYQLSMVEQVREAMEKANQRVYGDRVTVH
jgi:hypothetical protein